MFKLYECTVDICCTYNLNRITFNFNRKHLLIIKDVALITGKETQMSYN